MIAYSAWNAWHVGAGASGRSPVRRNNFWMEQDLTSGNNHLIAIIEVAKIVFLSELNPPVGD